MSTTDPRTESPPADPRDATARLLRARASVGLLRIEVSGRSMGRTIVEGSTVLVAARDRPRWGQIWAFVDHGGRVAVHRCVRPRRSKASAASTMLSFRGDANGWRDPGVPASRLIGRVVAVETDGRTVPLGLRLGATRAVALAARRGSAWVAWLLRPTR